jgi:hypothetical protein
LGALDRLRDVGYHPVTPAAQLVAEDPEASRTAAPDRAFGDDATLRAVAASDGSLLDHEASLRHAYDERRVIEVAGRAPFEAGHHAFEDPSVQTY